MIMNLLSKDAIPEATYLEERMNLRPVVFGRKYEDDFTHVLLGFIETDPFIEPSVQEIEEFVIVNGKTYLPVKFYDSHEYGSQIIVHIGTLNNYAPTFVDELHKVLKDGYLPRAI